MPRRFYETPSPARLGRIALTGVFAAVALVLAARWFVAADYNSIGVGDSVDADNAIFRGQIMSIEDGNATVLNVHNVERTFPVSELTEL